MVISLLDKNEKINCLRINTTWHIVTLPQVVTRALAYPGNDADYDNVGTSRGRHKDELYRQRVSALLDEQAARTALVNHAALVQELFLGRPYILSLLTEAPSFKFHRAYTVALRSRHFQAGRFGQACALYPKDLYPVQVQPPWYL